MARKNECQTGLMVKTMDPEDLEKIHTLRAAGITWPSIAIALRRAGWLNIAHSGLSRHFRGICMCEVDRAPVIDLSFTPVTRS